MSFTFEKINGKVLLYREPTQNIAPFSSTNWNRNTTRAGAKRYIEENFVGIKAKGRISKRVFQENKARQIFRKNEHF